MIARALITANCLQSFDETTRFLLIYIGLRNDNKTEMSLFNWVSDHEKSSYKGGIFEDEVLNRWVKLVQPLVP